MSNPLSSDHYILRRNKEHKKPETFSNQKNECEALRNENAALKIKLSNISIPTEEQAKKFYEVVYCPYGSDTLISFEELYALLMSCRKE